MIEKKYTIKGKVTKVCFMSLSDLFIFSNSRIISVFDTNTRELFPDFTGDEEIVLAPGETTKNWDSIETIISKALDTGAARDSLFVGAGGGVICDMTAFAASIYMRGAEIVLIPTTLLAMADAAFGGKTGIDFMGYKNMIGTFLPASEVRICIELLHNLPQREYMNGLAEIIKHGLLRDKIILRIFTERQKAILARNKDVLTDLVQRSLAVKAWYVEQDAVESGIRTHLNLGHTFGHALESVSGFTGISHGEAVVWGMVKALETGVKMGVTDPEWLKEILTIVKQYSYRTTTPTDISTAALINALQKDKKKKDNIIRFVLQKKQGDTFLSPIDEKILIDVLSSS